MADINNSIFDERANMGFNSIMSNIELPKDPQQAKEWVVKQAEARMKKMRSWSAFFNKNNFSAPKSPQTVISRVIANLAYYSTNYLLIFLVISLYSM